MSELFFPPHKRQCGTPDQLDEDVDTSCNCLSSLLFKELNAQRWLDNVRRASHQITVVSGFVSVLWIPTTWLPLPMMSRDLKTRRTFR